MKSMNVFLKLKNVLIEVRTGLLELIKNVLIEVRTWLLKLERAYWN